VKALEPKIRAWAVELIDAIAARGSCEYIGDFSKHFPTGIFIDMMGLPRDLLGRFVDEPNTVLSREALLPERRATVAFDRSIDLQVSRLRQKLAAIPGGEELVLTVRNEGYVLASPVRYE